MRIIGVEEYGGPEALAVHEVPEPHAGPGEVRIAVRAAAVNPTDTTTREGMGASAELPAPHVPGMDAAGVIDEVGEPTDSLDTSGWSVGERVMAMAVPLRGHGGAYVEYLIADADSLARIPEGRSLEEASTLPMNGLTALQALDLLALEPGQILAVTGAAGTLGGYVIQLATQRGLTVIADAAEKDRERVSASGADHVVPRGEDFAREVREVFPDGVDGLVDAAVLDEAAAPAVRPGGGFATVRGWRGPEDSSLSVHRVMVPKDYHRGDKLDTLREAVESGAVTLHVADVLPAEQAGDAHRRLARGGVRGRLVLTF